MSSAPIRVPHEAQDIYAISTLDAYLAAAQDGKVSESLGPLLALSILADRRGLAGEEICATIAALVRALVSFGYKQAAAELLRSSINAFIAGDDLQSALCRLVEYSSASASPSPEYQKGRLLEELPT